MMMRQKKIRYSVIGINFMISYAALIAAVVTFAWSSQAAQDKLIAQNQTAIAVSNAKLDAINAKLDELRAILGNKH